MERQLVNQQELADLMTAELRRRVENSRFSFGLAKRLQEPDDCGCNWSNHVTVRGSGVDTNAVLDDAYAIIRWAQESYNLAPDPEET